MPQIIVTSTIRSYIHRERSAWMDQLVPRCPCRVRSNMLNASTSLNPKLVELFVTQVGPAARSGTPIEPHTTEAYAVEHEHSEPHLFAHLADLPVTPFLENKPQLVWLAPEIGTPLDDTRTRRRCERRRGCAQRPLPSDVGTGSSRRPKPQRYERSPPEQ